MVATLEQILAAQDIRHEDVPVPEWGLDVRVRVMTGTERDAFGAALVGAGNKPDMTQYRLRLLASCIVGEDGVPLFGANAIEQLGRKSATALDRLCKVAERLNGMAADSAEAAQGN